ncbi:flagellar basal body rod protein FlgC [Aliarcobacter butzleri]|uniref:Flagellar basal-body rod protein FlgC n=1 Tax=Aliarcobacter butzleri L351 TaxID=1447259 RepID=A0A837J5D2_9BACT|nr:flagellar basal body rod protein FlgC [Aliarcobacter butzleri]KLE00751.1 flagellar basal body rod protein FlgC [Aliarcobacter butzleri L351]KLE11878.1 flagellar basal body rod protein FlgC [Aliarcobacter butzleri L350]MCG3659166.1 flagellar basal body rod protein FlgC [Aliarcobacter butzleri]MCG3670463.1 flagellar basal body rod protein FlgC [Aliarcobacter butzleri]MDN5059454.1 flagellar basal body rod protein FlgC [Aliarcobacter butzleri]
MGFFDGYNVATSGMSAQRTRINVVSANIANAKTTHTAEGGPYKKQEVVFEDVLVANTSKRTNANDVETTNSPLSESSLRGVGVRKIIQSDAKPVLKYDPTHPDANEKGYVAYPDINPVIEMVNLIEAMRSYEANVTSFNTHRGIDSKTLEILNS